MGYQHRLYSVQCGSCETKWLFSPHKWTNKIGAPESFVCKTCGAKNTLRKITAYPNVPREMFCGHEKHKQMRVYPYPPEFSGESWALPYTVRSFLNQATRQLGGCRYSSRESGELFGEPTFGDTCTDPEDDYGDYARQCHVLCGFTQGEPSCPGFENVKSLCQTENERRFLWAYLALVKGRTFPMLIPQARVGVAERRRPDFVAFVPVHQLKYSRYAIELDGAHTDDEADQARDFDLAGEGYIVISLRPGEKGYFSEVQNLIERFHVEMSEAETSQWEVAMNLDVLTSTGGRSINDEDIPF